MSTIKTKNVQVGTDSTASNNFTIYTPGTPDGTVRIGNGNVGAATDKVTITSAGDVTVTGSITANGSTLATQNSLGVRNLIINGDMRIDQRNSGSAVTSASNVYLTDRWQLQISGTTNTPSFQQVTDAPTGFQYSLKATSNGSETISVTDAVTPRQRIEGLNSAHLLYGSANAKTITVSFWVKSSLTGTWNVAINNSAFNRSYVAEYTISSANTWEYKTVTISGDTSGTWNTDNTTGIVVMFPVDAGTNLNGTANTWLSGSYRTTSGSNRLLQTSGATWQITGVQLEIGSATPFEHRPYDMELQRCQRYFYKSYGQDTGAVPVTSSGWLGSRIGIAYATSYVTGDWRYPVTMRANPTLSIYHQDGTANAIYEIDTGAKKTITATNYGNDSGFWRITSSSAFTANKHYYFQLVANAEL